MGLGLPGAAVWGVGQGPHSHDLMARADVETYQRLPWKENVALFSSNLYVDGEPHPYCPRGNLLRMTKLFADEGYVLNGGFEPEHFLVVRDGSGGIKIWDPAGIDTLSKPCYDFKGMCQAMDYLQDVIRYGNRMGLGIYQSDHEDANGQYEINFGWTNALHASDRLIVFRMMTSQIAAKYGCLATYMAKPFADKTGSGAHLHFHVADAASGKNLFPLEPGDKRPQGPRTLEDRHQLYWRLTETYSRHHRSRLAHRELLSAHPERRIRFLLRLGLHLDPGVCLLRRQQPDPAPAMSEQQPL